MNAIYIPSGIQKPFAFIDDTVILALQNIGFQVSIIEPNEFFNKQWEEIKNKLSPKLLIVMLGEKLTAPHLECLKTMDLPKAIWYTDDPYAIDKSLQSCEPFDWIFTNESEAVPIYKQRGKNNVFHLPLAAPFPVYSPIKKNVKQYESDIVFLGSAFKNRLRTFRKIKHFLQNYKTKIIGPGWDLYSKRTNIYCLNHWVSPQIARKYYCGSKIALNIHRSYNDPYLKQNRANIKASTPNNRTFEIAACSSFQIQDFRSDLDKLYDISKEIICCKSILELKEKLSFFLPRENLREKIAIQAYQRTLKQHLYEHRLLKMISIVAPKIYKNLKITPKTPIF